jgi:epoxyqueuosine reductase
MLTSAMVKDFARSAGADLAGIASVERYAKAPPEMHPRTIFPETKSIVVLASRILHGSYRGIQEGTEWSTYWIYSYGSGIYGSLEEATLQTQLYIESFGWEAVEAPGKATLPESGPERKPVAEGKLPSDVTVHMRLSAAAAGLGELGWSKVFLTPEFGPRQRFCVILTDAELEPDPLVPEGQLCDRCMACVRECPGHAISESRKVSTSIEGRTYEWGEITYGKCKLTHWGMNKEASPFFAKDLPGFNFEIDDQAIKWRDAYDLGWAVADRVRYMKLISTGIEEIGQVGRPGSICGARGCIGACYRHLGRTPRVRNRPRGWVREGRPS